MNRNLIVMTLVGALFSSLARAGVVEYGLNDRDEWFTDVGGPSHVSTVDFTGYSDFTPISDQWAHLGVHFSGFVVAVGESFFSFPNDGWGLRGEPDINVAFDEAINWLAMDFPGSAFLELYYQDTLIFSSGQFGVSGGGNFGGIVSSEPFDAVRIYRMSTNVAFLDDLHFGLPIAVPAPTSIVVFALTIVLKRRRRR